jgi:pimeloyl-ACP methyl ester carboxylesterase
MRRPVRGPGRMRPMVNSGKCTAKRGGSHRGRVGRAALLALLLGGDAAASAATESAPVLQPCWLKGLEHQAVCGSVQRPLDPAAPGATQIAVHYAVVPALARNKRPDPVFFFAGGPGQSAVNLAGPLSRQMARLLNRRDLVLVDQRGTGRSAPLYCAADAPTRPLRELADPVWQRAQLAACREALQQLPQGDLRQYTTTIAMADADAVRRTLGAERINLVGGSYGTRAVLEYLRLYPGTVRRAVIDGVAPPDMVLPAAVASDTQAAFDALLAACLAEPGCRARHPQLRGRWQQLLASLPRPVTVPHPVTGLDETFTLTRDMLGQLVRLPLYSPVLASALPHALDEAAQGRFVALMGLAAAIGGGRDADLRLAMGMHLSVVCAEDLPRLAAAPAAAAPDIGNGFADIYRDACAAWPRGVVPADFYRMPASSAPVLVLSGGLDPVTPPRHGARAAAALGARARHVVVPQAGHGVMGIGCLRDLVFRFVDAADDDQALQLDAGCAQSVPRPPAFQPVRPAPAGEAAR